jgi:hypothetical protein
MLDKKKQEPWTLYTDCRFWATLENHCVYLVYIWGHTVVVYIWSIFRATLENHCVYFAMWILL